MSDPTYRPTPMHPACCAICGKPMLHTCDPHIKSCYVCRRKYGGAR